MLILEMFIELAFVLNRYRVFYRKNSEVSTAVVLNCSSSNQYNCKINIILKKVFMEDTCIWTKQQQQVILS